MVADDTRNTEESVQGSPTIPAAGAGSGGITTAVVGPVSARLTMKQVVHLFTGRFMKCCKEFVKNPLNDPWSQRAAAH